MGNTLFRDLSIYWSMFHVALIFVMLFRSRFNRKKSLILVGVGIGWENYCFLHVRCQASFISGFFQKTGTENSCLLFALRIQAVCG